MTTTHTAIESLRRRHRVAEKKFNAMSAALALVQMDPHAKEDLAVYLSDAKRASDAGDTAALKYIVDAIAELFSPADVGTSISAESVAADLRRKRGGAVALDSIAAETDAFRTRYLDLKGKCGFRTIREMAKASGLSPTTVQAIENGGYTPQWRTLDALCKAFNTRLPKSRHVSPSDFRAELDARAGRSTRHKLRA